MPKYCLVADVSPEQVSEIGEDELKKRADKIFVGGRWIEMLFVSSELGEGFYDIVELARKQNKRVITLEVLDEDTAGIIKNVRILDGDNVVSLLSRNHRDDVAAGSE